MKTVKHALFMLWAAIAATAGLAQGRISVAGTGDTSSPKAPVRPAS